ncbi:MAG TPA: DNA polymerase III subunit delta [Methylophilaceae bacterium]|jgi:DNA polymerase-3 subunit delta|nr:DNA polymerase III subunit delta [Methylophilaceae bacterium]HBO18374.1 DNA polymerase III subunit delta [Methylophilaceae bacterium]HCB67953.1 DNA polymerase III subunit delta [Methylophilaceae bacterium]HCC73124.1 DNA polymerase III subunit delta [Methylophilaceae bacterium]
MAAFDSEAFSKELQKNQQSKFLLLGDEALSRKEAFDIIRQFAKEKTYTEKLSFTVDRFFKWDQCASSLSSQGLFSQKRIIEIIIPSGKINAEGGDSFYKILQNLTQNDLLVVHLPQIDKETKFQRWFKEIEKIAYTIKLDEIKPTELAFWLKKRASLLSIDLDEESIQLISQLVHGNMLAADQELNKLALLFPGQSISYEKVSQSISNVSRYDTYELTDYVLNGDQMKTLLTLNFLKEEGQNPISITSSLSWVLKPMLEIKELDFKGQSLENHLTKSRIFGNKLIFTKKAMSFFSLKHLRAAIQKLSEIDKISKGVSPGDAWLETMRLCLGLAKIASRSRKI